jgi:hypothetical protein
MVLPLVARHTKRDQVVECIVAEITPLCQMMYLQVIRRTTVLTSPLISFEHSVAK